MLKKIDIKAFTFVEVIVVVIILSILGTIGFTQFVGSIADSRDTLRKSDIANISSSMKMYKQKKGSYPLPYNSFSGSNNSTIVFWQGKLNKNVSLSTIDKIPYDPKIEVPYLYSITTNKKEFEIALTLENQDGDSSLSLVNGNYKSVAKNVLPTILVATGNTIDISTNQNLFIFDNQEHNLAYDFKGNSEPVSDGTSFTVLLNDAEQNGVFAQNSDFETCIEIKKAGKYIGDGEYQIRSSTGALTGTGCTL
ncbi:MAG: prepilin-type N-terminal cleavage/methylation domain-containing protein [Candidatus Gracilibacteria bacterium]|nr:prepilin-type N-terminal cleavage/methylation domain-containing protein [Candidatus Gracilibacteria bacterium]